MTATATPTQAEALVANILDQHYWDMFPVCRRCNGQRSLPLYNPDPRSTSSSFMPCPDCDKPRTVVLSDGPRLVYADWLEEQGECERAEFIRCQIKVEWWANNRGPHPVLGNITGGDAGGSLAISQALIERHGAEWAGKMLGGKLLDNWLVEKDGLYGSVPNENGRDVWGQTATWTWHRGFPARFHLTSRQAWGEACIGCGGTGERMVPTGPGDIEIPDDCRGCRGRGRVGAILPAILAACPVEEVRISGKRPSDSIGVHGWYRREMVDSPTAYSDVLPEVWDLIDMDDVVRTTIHGWKMFPTPAAAHAALSRAVIRHGL